MPFADETTSFTEFSQIFQVQSITKKRYGSMVVTAASPRPAKDIKFADVPNGLAALGKALRPDGERWLDPESSKKTRLCNNLYNLIYNLIYMYTVYTYV